MKKAKKKGSPWLPFFDLYGRDTRTVDVRRSLLLFRAKPAKHRAVREESVKLTRHV